MLFLESSSTLMLLYCVIDLFFSRTFRRFFLHTFISIICYIVVKQISCLFVLFYQQISLENWERLTEAMHQTRVRFRV